MSVWNGPTPVAGNDLARAAERIATYRARISDFREEARRRYAAGTGGISILAQLSEATDELIVQFLEDALAALPQDVRSVLEEQTAVIAIGGSGRAELAPHSDVDLLFLHSPATREPFLNAVAKVVRDCWDAGLKLGHSVRTLRDTLAMARTETQFATALVEARIVWGNAKLCSTLQQKFYARVIRPHVTSFIDECVTARKAEIREHGSAVQQLEPDVKCSPGGLRDLHLIRWVGYARYNTTDFDLLRMQGALTREDAQTLLAAREFLSRIRVDLHFAAGKPQELLTREEQLRLAEELHFEATSGQRAVERFMQQYFRHSTAVADAAQRFVALQRPRSLASGIVRYIMTHRANGIYRVGQDEIDTPPRHRAQACSSLESLLKLYDLASLYRVVPSPILIESIKQSVPSLQGTATPELAGVFLSILRRGNHLGTVLRSMYETGVLERIVPEFAHARCLLQFNQYHSYTVDEHSLQAVEAVTRFEHDSGSLGTAYRAIHHKEILHLALLLHDAGKGYTEDHSEVGRRIVEAIAERWELSWHYREVLSFLVHKHLMMGHLAFRRDISDPEVLLRFSRDVGSPEILRMLYVLTAADVTAVGPGAWTNWKAELLAELYDRAMLVLSGEPSQFHEMERIRRIRLQVHERLSAPGAPAPLPVDWVDSVLDTLPHPYLTTTPAERIAADLQCIRRLGPDEVLTQSTYNPNMNTVEHRIITRDHIGSGCFSKITGVLTAKRLAILSAQINTSSDGIIIDSFQVTDSDFVGPPPDSRLHEIEKHIQDVLLGRSTVESLIKTHRKYDSGATSAVSNLPTRVVIDNDSSDRFTIIDVFAHDCRGLLYTIAAVILGQNLSIALAKISTHLDQVVDVFYVTDIAGNKLRNSQSLDGIKAALVQKIEELQHSR